MTDHISKLIEAIEDYFGIVPDSQEAVDQIVLKIQRGQAPQILKKSLTEIHYTIELIEMEEIDTALDKLNELVVFIANYMVESK
jgi:hypothetical protein